MAGSLIKGVVIDESSGSTGIPYNWVRSAKEREMVKDVIGVYLRYCFGDQKYIVLNLFSMGAWATGFNMALASQSLGVVKSVGPDIDKILDTMRFFGNKYPYILNGYGRKDSTLSIMGANIYPEDFESIVYSDPLLARFVHSFAMSLAEDARGNPRPCFDFELADLGQRSGIEVVLKRILLLGLAGLSRDYKKAWEEYAESVEPIIRTFGLNEGPFKEDPGRIKKRYVR